MGGTWACQLKAQLKSLSSLGREDLGCAVCCFEIGEMVFPFFVRTEDATAAKGFTRSFRLYMACLVI
jgi:hypothetical protein